MLFDHLRNALYEPSVRSLDVDEGQLLEQHREILQRKPMLRSAFEEFYREMAACADRYLTSDGIELELGSGAGFFKQVRPAVMTSDVRMAPHIDKAIDAQNMDLPDQSVRCIYAINVLHHLPDPDKFFAELCRVLKPGGGCILVEPHNGLGSRLLHKHLHKDEHFDPDAKGWVTEAIRGPMSGANQALAYIIFERDRALFDQKYGSSIEIVHQGYCLNSMRYLLSGGLNFKQLLPIAPETLAKAERSFRMISPHWSFHKITVLRRR
jgi:SAM-dependent methyltransferase